MPLRGYLHSVAEMAWLTRGFHLTEKATIEFSRGATREIRHQVQIVLGGSRRATVPRHQDRIDSRIRGLASADFGILPRATSQSNLGGVTPQKGEARGNEYGAADDLHLYRPTTEMREGRGEGFPKAKRAFHSTVIREPGNDAAVRLHGIVKHIFEGQSYAVYQL